MLFKERRRKKKIESLCKFFSWCLPARSLLPFKQPNGSQSRATKIKILAPSVGAIEIHDTKEAS